ncbi:MAG: FAD-dependent oxidoreductase, partial [Candidatus Helarchaeota archaeon]
IIDKNNKIGGTLNLANKAPYKNEINNIMNYYNYKIKDLNIDLRLNTVLTPKIVDDIQPDILIIATGSKPLIPKINGLESIDYKIFSDVLEDKVKVGNNVVVIGGGMVGIELSEFLVSKNKKVTIIEKMNKLGANIDQMVSFVIMYYLQQNKNIEKLINANIVKIDKNKIVVEIKGKSIDISYDDVVISTGMGPNLPDLTEIKSKISDIKKIGDCKKPKKIVDAVSGAYKLIMKMS